MSSEEIFAKVYGSPKDSSSTEIFSKVYGEEKPLESRTKRPGAGGKAFLRGAFKVAKDAAKLRPENILMPRKNFPGEEILDEKVEELIGDPEAGFGEKVVERGTEILPYLLGGEGALLGKLGRAGLAAAAGEGAKEAELGPIGELLSEGVALGAPGFRKKIVPKESQKELIDFLRKRGLSEQEISTAITTPSKSRALKNVAKTGGPTRRRIDKTQKAFGNIYDTLKAEGKESVILSTPRAQGLKEDLLKIVDDLPEETTKNAESKIAKTFQKPIKAKDLMDLTWKLNQEIFSGKAHNPKKALNSLKDPIQKALHDIDPKLAKDFSLTQDVYSNFVRGVRKNLQPSTWNALLKYGKIGSLVTGLASGNPLILKGLIGTEATRYALAEVLLNPRFKNLTNQMLKAINSNKAGLAKKVAEKIEKELQSQGINLEEEDFNPQSQPLFQKSSFS